MTRFATAVPTKESAKQILLGVQLGCCGLVDRACSSSAVRTVHGWSWLRSLGALGAALALLAAIVGVFAML